MIQVTTHAKVRQFKLARSIRGKSWYYTAAYYVDGLLIDTGCAHTSHEMFEAVKDLPVRMIVNTHSHEDHIGANALLGRHFGLTPFIHDLGLPVLADARSHLNLRPYQRVMWGWPEAFPGRVLGDAVETDSYKFRVIHTPGHSPDHVSLFEPDQGWLFTGDAFIGGRDRTLRADYNIYGIRDSLEKLLGLNPAVIFPASGKIRENPSDELASKIAYLEEIGRRAKKFSRQGLSYRRISLKLFGWEGPIFYITLGHFSGRQLVRSLIEDLPESRKESV